MSGMTVLDIGAWDGFYSFACEKRGAIVTASDKFVWEGMDLGNGVRPNDAGFDFAHKHLNSNVKKLFASVEELDPQLHGKFDIVLMLCVIYHAKDPIGYLQKAKDMSNDLVCIETHVDLIDLPFPVARYYIGDELNNDNTNFWGPNPLAVCGMMTDMGYKDIQERQLRTGRMIFTGKVN
jgi:tRNA (mo5U34)-methyltransferase